MRVKLRTVEAWRECVERGREQRRRLEEAINKLELRKGLRMLKRVSQVINGLDKLSIFFLTRSKR